jgi:hypothetical protein
MNMLKQIFTQPVIDTENYTSENIADFANEMFEKYGVMLDVRIGGRVYYQIHSSAFPVQVPTEALPKKLQSYITRNLEMSRGICGFKAEVRPETITCWNDDTSDYWSNKI